MQEDLREYVTFTTTDKSGKELEMAVVDEFEYEHKNYLVGALIEDDCVNENGLYIFRIKESGEDIKVDKIMNAEEYQKIAQAYMDMEE